MASVLASLLASLLHLPRFLSRFLRSSSAGAFARLLSLRVQEADARLSHIIAERERAILFDSSMIVNFAERPQLPNGQVPRPSSDLAEI